MTKRLAIAGGFYRESCRFPPSDEYWGSGGRASAAIAEMADVDLVTAADTRAEWLLASIAKTTGFRYSAAAIPETIVFRYQHGLSTPIIWPPPHALQPVQLRASGDCVLQFGMLEASVEVDAETVIYDPQEPFSPRHFQAHRKPRRLAYVLNAVEARKLGNNADLELAAKRIMQESEAEVVVVKRGASGALVVEKGKTENVPTFETSTVWPIGSGDVFAAIFAVQWGIQGLTGLSSAMSASRATAEYVETRALPISRADVIDGTVSRRELHLTRRPLSQGEYDVYLAGPFFNMPQVWLVDEARSALQGLGLKVFSPYHDVGIGKGKDVAPQDIEALERSRAVFALIDGVDAGTIFEAGYARAHGKPVVAFTQSTPDEPLKMISGTGCEVVIDFVSAIYRVAWAAWR